MKRKLIALAVAGAFVAPAAMADTANVNVYGVMNMSYDSTNTGAQTNGASQSKVSSNSSRIGFKGSEDLGGGTSAIFQVETQLYPDNSSAQTTINLGNRNTFVGISGESWGTVLLGRNDTPYKASTRRLDLFADGIADNRSLMGGVAATVTAAGAATFALTTATCTSSCTVTPVAGAAAAAGFGSAAVGFDSRPADVVQYNSPNMNGFSASLAYVHGAESAANTGSKGNTTSGALMYETGPIYVALAYQRNKFGAAGSGTLGAVAGGMATDTSERAWKLGGSYTTDQFQVNLVYEKTNDDIGAANTDALGHHTWYLGGKFNVTASDAVKLAYTKAGDLNMAGAGQNTGAKQTSVGYDHTMSKRTTVYALYTRLSNDTNARYNLSNAGAVSTAAVAGSLNGSPSSFSLGIKHVF